MLGEGGIWEDDGNYFFLMVDILQHPVRRCGSVGKTST